MKDIVIDTHVAVWYLVQPNKLSALALQTLEEAENQGKNIYLSSITVVEIQYLVEKQRLPQSVLFQLLRSIEDIDCCLVLVPLDLTIARTLQYISREQVPDMPDRIIAATAFYLGLPLVTRDHKIQAANLPTIW